MGFLQQTTQLHPMKMGNQALVQTLFVAPDALFAQHHGQRPTGQDRLFHTPQSADVLTQGVVDQHLGHTFCAQTVQHALHPQQLATKHRRAEFEHVIAGHIQHRLLDLLKTPGG